jgi:hypothetical protein
VWDTLTARERHRFHSDQGRIEALSFSEDGTRLASAGENTTTLVWDVSAAAHPLPTPMQELSTRQCEGLWSDLASADAANAFKAMKALLAAPDQAVPFFSRHLRPIVAVDEKRVTQLLGDLDADAFAVRQKATKELEEMGEAVEPFLRQAIQGTPSIELRRRVEALLEKLSEASTERLRKLRAVEVLEWINTRHSRQLLNDLAQGAPDAWLTREAKTSLIRCGNR